MWHPSLHLFAKLLDTFLNWWVGINKTYRLSPYLIFWPYLTCVSCAEIIDDVFCDESPCLTSHVFMDTILTAWVLLLLPPGPLVQHIHIKHHVKDWPALKKQTEDKKDRNKIFLEEWRSFTSSESWNSFLSFPDRFCLMASRETIFLLPFWAAGVLQPGNSGEPGSESLRSKERCSPVVP